MLNPTGKSLPKAFTLPTIDVALAPLPRELQEAIVPFTTVLSNHDMEGKAKDARHQLALLEAMQPDQLSDQLLKRLERLPLAGTVKQVLLAEQANVSHPRVQQMSEQAQKWVMHPSPINKARGLVLKLLVDNLNGIVSAITRQARRLMALYADTLEQLFGRAEKRGQQMADKLDSPEMAEHPVAQHYKALQLAGQKGKALITHLRNALAKHHPQFTDKGVQQAYQTVSEVHAAPRNTLSLDALALRWLTMGHQNGRLGSVKESVLLDVAPVKANSILIAEKVADKAADGAEQPKVAAG